MGEKLVWLTDKITGIEEINSGETYVFKNVNLGNINKSPKCVELI